MANIQRQKVTIRRGRQWQNEKLALIKIQSLDH